MNAPYTETISLCECKKLKLQAVVLKLFFSFSGQKFAMLEMKVALTGIIRNFTLEPIDTLESIVLVPDLVLRPANKSIRVKFVKRSNIM